MSQVKIKQISELQGIIDTPLLMGVNYTQTTNFLTSSTGNGFQTGISLDYKPYSIIKLYVNGMSNDKLDSFYFSNDGGVTIKTETNLESGDVLYWNGMTNGYQLGIGDIVTISYEREYLSYISNEVSSSTPVYVLPASTFLDLGDTTSSTTTIDLSVAEIQKIRITRDTKLDFINNVDGKEYTIIPYINQEINPTVTYSNNVIFDGNLSKSIVVGDRKDSSFVVGTGFDGVVRSMVLQSDGKVLVGGDFTAYQGVISNRIIRLNSDGTIDTTFVVVQTRFGGFNAGVNSILVQSDGKILVGGNFTTYQEVSSSRIIRLNTDGTIDTTFVVGTGFNNSVLSMIEQSDGKILVGGYFTTYQGVSSNYIIRLNSDGSKDTGFVINTGFNSNSVWSMVLQSDNKILVGGYFTTYQGWSSSYIIRLNSDGSIDYSFSVGTGFNNTVRSILVQSDGKILVGGQFSTYQGVSSNYIIRLNTDGSKDTSFSVGTGFNSDILLMVLQSDGKILVSGSFTTYQGVSSPYIIRLNSDVSKDTTFVVGSNVFSGFLNSIVIQSDGKILVGGDFTTHQGVSSNRIIRLNSIPNPIYYKLNIDGNLIIS